jgi:hypothetical protein
MNEENIYEILNSYKEAIDVLLNRCDELVNQNRALEERVNKVESILFDEILEPARLALEADDKERRFGEFNDKYGEKLGAFDKILGAAEGNPDFSMARSAFDEYEKIPEPRPEEDVFVDGLIETVEEQIDSIKESLGIEPDAKVEITQDENGDTEIKADGEVVASETEETKDKEETTEEGTEAPAEEGEQGELDFDGDEEEEDDPEEIKKLEEELAKSL